MANTDQSNYTLRYNEILTRIEMAIGVNWVEAPLSSSPASPFTIQGTSQVELRMNGGEAYITAFDEDGSSPGHLILSAAGGQVDISADGGMAISTDPGGNWIFSDIGTLSMPQVADPEAPQEGTIWYEPVSHTWRGWNGADFVTFDVTPDA